jgi:plasmid stabilization system protein ParE
MARYTLRFTPEGEAELLRLYTWLAARDVEIAQDALRTIYAALKILKVTPFSCRMAPGGNMFYRELVIPFGSSGYVALFQIDNKNRVTILAVKHQREADYFGPH